jgi:hypothetical protein
MVAIFFDNVVAEEVEQLKGENTKLQAQLDGLDQSVSK